MDFAALTRKSGKILRKSLGRKMNPVIAFRKNKKMKKELKLFATDMDGTFLRSDRTFNHEKLKTILDAFDQQGLVFCASSGRQLLALEEMIFHDFRDQIAFVAENGGVVSYKGETIFAQTLSTEQIKAIVDLLARMTDSPKHDFLISGIKGSYCLPDVSDWFYAKAQIYYANVQKVSEIDAIDDQMIKVTTNFPEDKTAECERYITDTLAFARATTTGFTSIDIGSKGINKASGLAHLLAHFKWHPEQLAAFGDQMNDFEMLEYAGTAYAVSNACPEILNCADEIILSNDDDAVLVQIEKLMQEKNENEKLIHRFFTSESPLILKNFPAKTSKKLIVLQRIAQEFSQDKHYSSVEIDQRLKTISPDFATLRRALVDYQFMERTDDGRDYWLKK